MKNNQHAQPFSKQLITIIVYRSVMLQVASDLLTDNIPLWWLVLLFANTHDETPASKTYARHGGRQSTADERQRVEDDERERTRSGGFASAVSSRYDANGNVIEEKDTISANPNEETSGLLPATMSVTSNANGEKVYKSDYAWGYFKDAPTGSSYGGSYKRTYEWDSRNLLIASSDNTNQVYYTYDANGERTNKYTHRSETLYFNTFWNWHRDSAISNGQYSKNIYLGTTRLVTKLHNRLNELPAEQSRTDNCYYYHSDHLGSAQLITDYKGNEYQRLEYTPYGELWIEKTSSAVNTKYLPYKFTGKEQDEETGLYYFGARYLDAKYSRWLSADSALGSYLSGSSAGAGGIYNHVNLNLYHYGGNNPIRYTDPNGMWIDNGDGTFTAEKGDTLWDIYGKDWKEKSGYEGDPTKLQIGDTVGIKNELGVDIPDASGGNGNEAANVQVPELNNSDKNTSNLFKQGFFGAAEIIGGVIIWAGLTMSVLGAEAASNGAVNLNPSFGEGVLGGYSLGTALVADGIGKFSGALMGQTKPSVFPKAAEGIIMNPMLDVGKGLRAEKERQDKNK